MIQLEHLVLLKILTYCVLLFRCCHGVDHGVGKPTTGTFSRTNSNVKPQNHYDFDKILKQLRVCNNSVVSDIPGGAAAVMEAGKLYVETMRNNSLAQLDRSAHLS